MTSHSNDSPDQYGGPNPARLEIIANPQGPHFILTGDWTIETAKQADHEIDALLAKPIHPNTIEISGISNLDMTGAWIIIRLLRGFQLPLQTLSPLSKEHHTLFLTVSETNLEEPLATPRQSSLIKFLSTTGENIVQIYHDMLVLAHLMGGLVKGLFGALVNIRQLRITSVTHHIDQTGLKAVPIVALMSFLVGAIVAQQGAYQLRKFGAEPFVIDLVGILVLREVSVLLTAILVAGRSGSAFTAEIGSMKMREEIDALRVMGISVTEVLITPRVLALIISLPLLGLVANLAGLVGAGVLLWAYSDIAVDAYISWLRDAVAINTFLVGLIKAPFMALIIALISCSEGLQVGGSAESLGRHTTAAVVKSIFLVVVVDGIFAIFFAAIGF